jgi:tape measure domain-containing protein
MADGRSVKVVIDVVAPGGAEKAKKPLQDLEKETKRINAATTQNAKQQAKIIESTTQARVRQELADERRLERERKKIANDFIADIKRVERESKSLQNGSGAFKGGLAGGFLGSAGASAISSITSALSQGSAAVFQYSKNVESLEIAFQQFAGSAQGAKKQIEELQKLNLETPFGLEALAQASQRLQGVGVESKKVIPLLKDIGNVVAATGKVSVERFDGITTAITQVISKTKVSAEEMEQLAERGVPAWKILSEYTGNSISELRKLGEQGKLSSDILVAALQKVSREKYGDALEKQNKTLEGSLNRIKNVLLEAARTWFKPLYEEASKFGATFAERITANETKAKSMLENFGFALGQSLKRGMDSGYVSVASAIDAVVGGGATTAGINLGRGAVSGYNTPQGAMPNAGQSYGMENYDPQIIGKMNEAQKKMFEAIDKEEEKRRKEREEAAKKELQAQINLYSDQLTAIQKMQSENFQQLSEGLKETGDTKAFAEGFNEMVRRRNEEVPNLVLQWEELVKKQTLAEKKGQFEREEVFKNTERRKEEIVKHGTDMTVEAQKLIKESLKKNTVEEMKAAEEKARRTIELAGMTAENEKKATEATKLNEIQAITDSQAAADRYLKKKKEVYEALLKDVKGNAEKETEIRHELEKVDLEIKEQQLETSNKVGEATRKETEKSADLTREYNEVLGEFAIKMKSAGDSTEYDRVQKMLLSETYKDLTQAQRDFLLEKAKEVDTYEKSKKAAEELGEQQKRLYEQTTDFFEDKLQAFADRGFKGLFQSLLDDLKSFLIKAAAQLAASKFLKFLTGQDIGGGSQSSGGGFFDSIKGLFNIGTAPFNPNAGGGGALGNLGGLGQTGGFIAKLFGLGGGAAASGAAAGAAPTAAMAAAAFAPMAAAAESGGAAAGAAGAGGGSAGGLGAFLTNPWTIGIAGAALGAFGLYKLFTRGKAEKKLKAAAMSEFGINVGDKKLLKNIKQIAKAYGINVKDDATAKQAVNLEESKDMLASYAESTGQSTERINKDKLSDPDFAGNNFSSSGGRASSATSDSFSSFTSSPSTTATTKTSSPQTGAFGYFVEVVERLERKISSMAPGDVVTVGASQAKDAIFDANQDAITSNGRRAEFVRRDLGEQYG